MPKRTEAQFPENTPEKKEVAQKAEVVTPKAEEDTCVFTEAELRSKENDELTAMLACYKVDPKKEDGKNTTLKLVKLFLQAQQKCLQAGKKTPAALEAFKSGGQLAAITASTKPTVTYSVSFTKNMENYESLKVMAEVTLPVNPTSQELADAKNTLAVAKELVESQLLNDIDGIAQSFKP